MVPAKESPPAPIPVPAMRFLLPCALAAVLLAAVPPAGATTVEPLDFAELVASSDYVVRGRVVARRDEVVRRDGRDVPYTRIEVAVQEVVAGTPPAQVVLRVLGGRLPDGSELRVDGVPPFTVGDEEFLFVKGNGVNFYPTNGVMYGRYPVLFDKRLGRNYVARSNRVPLAATAEVGLPLAEGKLAQLLRRQIRADDALTPEEFSASIRAARGAKDGKGVSHAR